MTQATLTAAQIVAAMKSIVEAPNYPFLKAYKDDFYKHDIATIEQGSGECYEYLWVVSLNGTHLTRIGIHERQNDWAKATLESSVTQSSAGADIYRISSSGLRKVTYSQALDALKDYDYVVHENAIRSKQSDFTATFKATQVRAPGNGNQYVDVVIEATVKTAIPHHRLTALVAIAGCEGIKAWGSLFVQVRSVTLNGQDIASLIEEAAIRPVGAFPQAA